MSDIARIETRRELVLRRSIATLQKLIADLSGSLTDEGPVCGHS